VKPSQAAMQQTGHRRLAAAEDDGRFAQFLPLQVVQNHRFSLRLGQGVQGGRQTQQLIIDGFFPVVSLEDKPQGGRRTGLTEWGLPYVQDPAVTRHMAAFWQRFHQLLLNSPLFP